MITTIARLKMSRESLTDLIHAAEHSFSFRKELIKCKNFQELFIVAKKNGFHIREEDLQEDMVAENIGTWFNKSKIAPIRPTL